MKNVIHKSIQISIQIIAILCFGATSAQDSKSDEYNPLKQLNNLSLDSFDTYYSFVESLSPSILPLNNKSEAYARFYYTRKAKNAITLITIGEEILQLPACTKNDSIYIFSNLGEFLSINDYKRHALEYQLKLLPVFDSSDLVELKQCYHNIGMNYYNLYKLDKSVYYFKKAIAIEAPKIGRTHPYQMMNSLGLAYLKLNKLDSAEACFQSLLKILNQDTTRFRVPDYFEGLVKGNLSITYEKMGLFEKAIPLLKADLAKAEELGITQMISRDKLYLGNQFTSYGDFDQAKKYLDEGFELAKQNQYKRELEASYLYYAYYFGKKKDYIKSAAYFNKHTKFRDSVRLASLANGSPADYQLELLLSQRKSENEMLKLERNKDLAELKAKKQQLYFAVGLAIILIIFITVLLLSYRKQGQLNNALLQKNLEINKRGQELIEALEEKDLMMKEIHHRVKNNLQLVQSLLRLQSQDVDNEMVSKAFEESINRLNSMSLIHQKLYQDEKLKEIEYKSYMGSLINYLRASFNENNKSIKVNLDSKEFNISLDRAIPLALIMNEIINNAYKHAFKGRKEGEVLISMEKTGNQVKIIVSDDGIGLPENFEMNDDSFGINLINILVSQLEGEIKTYNKVGANFEIIFEDILNP